MDDSIDVNLRPRRQVVHRLLIQIALAHRAGLETLAAKAIRPEDEEARFDLVAWLIDARAVDELTPTERRILETPLGKLQPRDLDQFAFGLDAAFPLAWAIRIVEGDPAAPAAVDGGTILAAVPSPEDDSGAFLNGVQLRDLDDIAAMREAAEVWHWRLDIESERRLVSGAERDEIDTVIGDAAVEMIEASLLDTTIDGDFPLRRQPVRSASEEEIAYALMISEARLMALNWLCGYGASWEDVPLDIE